jgi:nicotinate-nucleotide--dimethylbenzimidazole phosphoribosyltransferase
MNPLSKNVVDEITRNLEPPSEPWRQRARQHLDTLTKPLGSLGRLEDLAAQMVAIRQENFAEEIGKGAYIFAADHGVAAEGVSAYPREVTHQMVLNYLSHGAAINVLARLHRAELHVIDVGVDADFQNIPGMSHRKVARGTSNMLHDAAMTDEHLAQALSVGADAAAEAVAAGQTMIALGEMGIGNTTSASAITCALTGATALEATGRGTGIDADSHKRKIGVVQGAIEKHFGNAGAASSPLDILRCVGGLEIAAMAGMILAAAKHKRVIVVDGIICTAAAAIAVALAPAVHGYLVAGHQSEEPGHRLLLKYSNLSPVLTFNMRLGEATGAVLAMPILESAMALYTQMATFASAGVSEASR